MHIKRIAIILLTLCLLLSAVGCGGSPSSEEGPPPSGASADNTFTVTDLAGRDVELNTPVSKAIALAGPSYEKVFMLGQQDRLIGAHFMMVERPWVVKTNPGITAVAGIQNPAEPNVEELLTMQTDCVFFWDYEAPLSNFENAGIPVVVVQKSVGNPTTTEEFIAYQKQEIQAFADALGVEAQAKADDWYDYFDERVNFVTERTAGIADADRKTAIYAYGEDGLGVFSQYSYVSFWLEMAGGRNIADETGAEMDTTVTMEQVVEWDPDYIFMGRMESADPVLTDPKWASLSAVKAGQVYICPDGIMFWDYSSEGVLLMQFLAQKMYPELFEDFDMVAETQNYYKRFYNFDLTAEDAQQILDHLPPL